ncbi:MAG: hypothetical protein ABJE66_15045 [Deltaproteobacteria bacterium]
MRALVLLTVVTATLASAPARADENVAGNYDVKVDETASTCDPKPESFGKTKVQLSSAKGELTVKFATMYKMVGTATKDGQITAKTTKLIGTSVGGLSARYSVIGHAKGDSLELVLTAQYIRQDTNKPHCMQAWNVTGTRAK